MIDYVRLWACCSPYGPSLRVFRACAQNYLNCCILLPEKVAHVSLSRVYLRNKAKYFMLVDWRKLGFFLEFAILIVLCLM